jgi:hypothetical protein
VRLLIGRLGMASFRFSGVVTKRRVQVQQSGAPELMFLPVGSFGGARRVVFAEDDGHRLKQLRPAAPLLEAGSKHVASNQVVVVLVPKGDGH